MKKLCLTVALILLLTLCACGENRSEESIANHTFETVIGRIENGAPDGLTSLFARSAQDSTGDFRKSAVSLIEFIQGNTVFCSDATDAGISVDYKTERGGSITVIQSLSPMKPKHTSIFSRSKNAPRTISTVKTSAYCPCM